MHLNWHIKNCTYILKEYAHKMFKKDKFEKKTEGNSSLRHKKIDIEAKLFFATSFNELMFKCCFKVSPFNRYDERGVEAPLT
jgi:hypothetical protein